MSKILLVLFFCILSLNFCYCQVPENNNAITIHDSNNFQNFNFKNGKKENGVYFHFYKSDEFKTDLNHLAKPGFYVVTEFKTDKNLIKAEIVRYFNFGFPETDFISSINNEIYFLFVHYSENKEIALQKLNETKLAGVPHVWIHVIEE